MTVEEKDIQSLLSQVGSIKQKYDQIAEITGEKFNVFSILGLQDSEVRLHSNLINELLNPNGKHGQKDLFLKLFIALVNQKTENETTIENTINISSNKIKDFNTETAKSAVEIHTGFKNEDATEGGRIDILVDDNNKHGIIIENKIWAGDQENQLLRYHNYGLKTFNSFHLIYLTLDGNDPSEWSTKKELNKHQYICLSYKEDIVDWLELCRKECTQLPIIRETLTQYINQIKNYSGQSNNNKMSKEIMELLSKNIENSFAITHEIDNLRLHLMQKLKQDLELLATKLHLKIKFEEGLFFKGNKWKTIFFYKESWINNNIAIKFGFEKNWFNDLIYGFGKLNYESDSNSDVVKSLNSININNYEHSEHWPLHQYFNPYCWYSNTEIWIEISNGKAADRFEVYIKELLDITNTIKI